MKHKSIALFLMFFILLLCLGVAFAAETAEPALEDVVVSFLQETVFPILGVVVLTLVSILIQKISKKYKTDILLNNQALIESVVYQAIGYAEESAEKFVKEKTGTVSSKGKLSLAINYVLRNAPKVSREDAESYIQSMLARVKGAGATKDKAL